MRDVRRRGTTVLDHLDEADGDGSPRDDHAAIEVSVPVRKNLIVSSVISCTTMLAASPIPVRLRHPVKLTP